MNTLLKNPGAEADVAATRNLANPSERIFVAADGVVIRQLNVGFRKEAVW